MFPWRPTNDFGITFLWVDFLCSGAGCTLICSCGQQDFHDLSMPATCCAHESGDPCFGRPGFIKSSVQLWWCLDLVSSLEMCGCWSTIPSPSIGHDDIVAKGVEHGFSLRHSGISSKTNDWIIMVLSCSHQHLFWGEPGNKGKTKVRRVHKPSKILLLRYTGERDGLSNQAGASVWNSLELTCFISISYNLWDGDGSKPCTPGEHQNSW